MKDLVIQCAREAGKLLLQHFGQPQTVAIKESRSSIVTAADLASERLITDLIRQRCPSHNLLGEETGFQRNGSEFTWVIDPLDGTSNFAAGIPWFGVMVALLRENQPILGAMYLPVDDVLFVAERGQGASRNGHPLRLALDTDLGNTLCAYAMDAGADLAQTRRKADLLSWLVNRARNVRATNSLVDCCYTLEGRLGAWINHSCKIWDIAAVRLVFEEAGAIISDLRGRPIVFSLEEDFRRCYAVMGASPKLHPQVLEVIRQSGFQE